MSAELDALEAAVTQETTVNQSAVALLQQLGAFLQSHANDPAAITNYAQQIQQNASDLANAVTANTPAAPAT